MSSPFTFGVGTGRITRSEVARRRRIAKKHGIDFFLVSGNDGHCACGRGCRLDRCPVKRWWFAGQNLGEPFNGQLAAAVQADVLNERDRRDTPRLEGSASVHRERPSATGRRVNRHGGIGSEG